MINFTMLAHSRATLTLQALRSLGDDPQVKAIVRCDAPQDSGLCNVLCSWSQQSSIPGRIVYFDGAPVGTGAARNDVIQKSQDAYGRGDYLYLSDNDVFFYPAVFEKLVPIYEYGWSRGFKVLGAYNHPFHRPVSATPVYAGGRIEISRINEVEALALQSILMKWEVWDQYGPFQITPPGRVCMGEDVEFGNKIKMDGGKLGVVDPPLLVNTGLTNSFGEKIPGWEMVSKECPVGVYCE